jgi:hypothetical protein
MLPAGPKGRHARQGACCGRAKPGTADPARGVGAATDDVDGIDTRESCRGNGGQDVPDSLQIGRVYAWMWGSMHYGRGPPARAVRIAGVREVRPSTPLQAPWDGGPEERAVDGGAVGRKRTAVRRPRHANMDRPNTHAHPHTEDEGPPGGAAAQGPTRGAAEGWRGRGPARGLQLQPGLRAAPGCGAVAAR